MPVTRKTPVNIRRVWAMPSPNTFSIPPVAQLLDRLLVGCAVVVDPFARNSSRGTITNDLNPDTVATYHLAADEFTRMLVDTKCSADVALFDPPYSPRQIKECYQSAGLSVGMETTQHAKLIRQVKNDLALIVKPGGIAICFGWNSIGFGINCGFTLEEIYLIAHGGSHNDTIITVERKRGNLFGR